MNYIGSCTRLYIAVLRDWKLGKLQKIRQCLESSREGMSAGPGRARKDKGPEARRKRACDFADAVKLVCSSLAGGYLTLRETSATRERLSRRVLSLYHWQLDWQHLLLPTARLARPL